MKNGVHLQSTKTGYFEGTKAIDIKDRYNINTLLVTNPLMPL